MEKESQGFSMRFQGQREKKMADALNGTRIKNRVDI
jgi:hypothetical protein